MCGIAGVYLRDPKVQVNLDKVLDTMLDEIESRGGDATGFVALGNEGVLEWQKAACGADDFCKYRRPVPEGTRTILAHTRWATQGLPAFVENNHPLRRGSFFVIHNGHISNDYKLFELAGRDRFGVVDSEAIPARFASLGKLEAAPKVMSELEGQAAIAVVDEQKPAELVLARGSTSPLFVLQTKKIVLFGSTRSTIEKAYEQHIGRLPKKAKILPLSEGTVLHFVDGRCTKRTFTPWKPPKVVYTYTPKYKQTSTEVLSLSKDSKLLDDDMLDCDGCGDPAPWQEMQFVEDEDGYYEQLCSNCKSLWDYQGEAALSSHSIHDAIDDEWASINKTILDEDAE